ncbi:hypothetical protein GWK47_040696 [Chionoecetes opilio]|uniref:Uncharacterized protein n=1 Tax=Chionoecetes opilio TaxID=41210 RepID=A0A8J5CZS8_CHIOP|nr:hypothetical protein GWK47_040696 [Chionoecetes opilio]
MRRSARPFAELCGQNQADQEGRPGRDIRRMLLHWKRSKEVSDCGKPNQTEKTSPCHSQTLEETGDHKTEIPDLCLLYYRYRQTPNTPAERVHDTVGMPNRAVDS